MSEAPEAGGGKGRKRQTAKTASSRAASKVKCTMHLTLEASQRLDIHATMSGQDRSEVVEALIQQHCRRWVVSDRGGDTASGETAA
jgi:BioD-like phosphotransacetylase family protein